jgi:hypothetical protein
MTAEDLRKHKEQAEKSTIIESMIIMRLEVLDRMLSVDRKAGLKEMSKLALQKLATDLEGATTGQAAITMIVAAITNSEQARWDAKNRKCNTLGPPARMDM